MKYLLTIFIAGFVLIWTNTLYSQQSQTVDIPGSQYAIYRLDHGGHSIINNVLHAGKGEVATYRSYIVWHNVLSFVPAGYGPDERPCRGKW